MPENDYEDLLKPLPDGSRFQAYYYDFEPTGVGIVDAVLSAVAIAGKGAHHTESWYDQNPDYYGGREGLADGNSAAELIQNNANRAATAIRALLAERADIWDAGAEAVRNRMDEFNDLSMDDPDNPYRDRSDT